MNKNVQIPVLISLKMIGKDFLLLKNSGKIGHFLINYGPSNLLLRFIKILHWSSLLKVVPNSDNVKNINYGKLS